MLALAGISTTAKIYLQEDFSGDWESRWVVSDWKKDTNEAGKWEVTAGKFFADEEKSKGLKTMEDAKFYAISTKFPAFSNKDKTMVFQYVVKHEQNIDCGGAYLKLLPGGDAFDAPKFGGDTPYAVMFGPDICGSSNKRTHVILHYDKKDDNLLVKKNVNTEDNQLTHLYTFVLRPDNTFEVFIDIQQNTDPASAVNSAAASPFHSVHSLASVPAVKIGRAHV